MYELLGICLVLTGLLAVNCLTSILLTALWRLVEGLLRTVSARGRAEILFGMRAIPPALALMCVGVLVVPAYITYEPRVTSEVVSVKLATLSLLSAGALVFALWRAYRSWAATRSLLRAWMRVADSIEISALDIQAFRIEHSFPIIAVVGSTRPRLFVAAKVLDSLTEEELAAAIAHERGHLVARDNMKRSILRACRDVLTPAPFGRSLDRAWAQAAEAAADEYAARNRADSALNLASALVKIAKMVPPKQQALVPLGAYLIGAEETGGVKARIRRLLDIASHGMNARDDQSVIQTAQFVALTAFGVFALAAASNPRVLIEVHELIERTVRLLC